MQVDPGYLRSFVACTPFEPLLHQENRTIPNYISLARLFSAPVLVSLLCNGQYKPALALFAVASVADFFDGYLARLWKQQTVFGTFLDPVADKILVGSTILSLGAIGALHPYVVGIIVLRDVGLIAGVTALRHATKHKDAPFFNTTEFASFDIKPTLLAKANTCAQFALIGFSLTHLSHGIPAASHLDMGQWVVAASTVCSGLEYGIGHMMGHSATSMQGKAEKHDDEGKSKSA